MKNCDVYLESIILCLKHKGFMFDWKVNDNIYKRIYNNYFKF